MTFGPWWGFNCPQVSSHLACQRICLFCVSASEPGPTPQLHILFRSPGAMISSRASVFCCMVSYCYYTLRLWINLAADLCSEKRCYNICTPSEAQRDTLMYRLEGGSTGSFSSGCARSPSACGGKLQHAPNCLPQTRCSKAFPSLPTFNRFTFGGERAWPLRCDV